GGQGGRSLADVRREPASHRTGSSAATASPVPSALSVSPAPTAATAPSAPSALPDVSAEFTLKGLTDAWPHLMAAARQQSRFLSEALGATMITEVAPPVVWLSAEGNATLAEGLQHQLKAVEGLIGKLVGSSVQVRMAAEKETLEPRAKRMSEGQARAERLRILRTKDPTLEAAAEGLDLEALE
ncbi:MAG TPA: hypothetical protein VFU03_10480, partial [Gemmatimonadales bacterium]|nr:hypothetical protein [Gemmatimonadales bacterium]